MSATRIAYRFAKSLIEVSKDNSSLDTTFQDMQTFLQVAANKEFSTLLKSPVVSIAKKKNIFTEIFKDKVSANSLTYLLNIVGKKREPYLPEIASEYINQFKTLNDTTVVKVSTAKELSASNLDLIKAKLLKSDSTLGNIDLDVVIDTSLIGGFKIEYDGKLYDASIAHKLESIKKDFFSNKAYIKN